MPQSKVTTFENGHMVVQTEDLMTAFDSMNEAANQITILHDIILNLKNELNKYK